jgi:transposase
LAGVIVLLALRMRLSRASIRELLREVFDLTLSAGVIDETIREAGRASLGGGIIMRTSRATTARLSRP